MNKIITYFKSPCIITGKPTWTTALFVTVVMAIAIVVFATPVAYSHSGRTDKNGGHNCSEKSKEKGLCTGYHYHNKGEDSIDHHHDGDEVHSHIGDDPQG